MDEVKRHGAPEKETIKNGRCYYVADWERDHFFYGWLPNVCDVKAWCEAENFLFAYNGFNLFAFKEGSHNYGRIIMEKNNRAIYFSPNQWGGTLTEFDVELIITEITKNCGNHFGAKRVIEKKLPDGTVIHIEGDD
jgi:hypothetical protein